jgi:hypothetical protein
MLAADAHPNMAISGEIYAISSRFLYAFLLVLRSKIRDFWRKAKEK